MKKKQDKKNVPVEAPPKLNKEKWYLEIVVRAYVIFILALYPLYVTGEGYNNIVYRKAQVFWAGTIAFLIIFAIFFLVYILGANIAPEQKRFWKRFSFADWALLAFLLALTLSFVFSPYRSTAWLGQQDRYDGYLTMLLMILCYFPISRYYKPKHLDLGLYAVGSTVLCIIGFLQYYGYDFLNLFPYSQMPYADESGNPYYSGFSIAYRSTIGNIDFLSCYVCMAIVVFGVLFVKSKGWMQYLYLSTAVMNFVLMIIGDADAGRVGTLGAMVLLIPYWIYTKQNMGKAFVLTSSFGLTYCLHRWFMINMVMPGWTEESRPVKDIAYKDSYSTLPLKPILILSIICLIIGICLIFINTAWLKPKTAQITGIVLLGALFLGCLAGVEVLGRDLPQHNIIHQAREIMHGNLEDHFGTNRGFIWKRAIERVPYQSVFGTGPDTFIHAFGKLNQSDAKNLYSILYDKAHNDFIQILLCEGVVGLLTYLTFIIGLILLSIKKSFDGTFALMALGGVLAYLIQSFFGIDTLIVTPIFWTLLAILRCAQCEQEQENECTI